MNKFYQTLFVLPLSGVAIALTTAPSLAGSFRTSGAVQYTSSPPTDLRLGRRESNRSILFFKEDQNYFLRNNLYVDIKNPGSYSKNTNLSPGTISPGVYLDSYFFHADPVGRRENNPINVIGSVTFEDEILGIITGKSNLSSSDNLGLSSMTFPRHDNRGVMKNDGRTDYVTLSSDRHTINLNLKVGTAMDQIRVITERSVAPTLSNFYLSSNYVNEGSSVTAYLKATDPNKDTISFYVDGSYIGKDYDRSGTRSDSTRLRFTEDGTRTIRAQAKDEDGKYSNNRYQTLTVRNVAPTLSNLTIPTINEGQSASATLYGTDPGADALTFYLNNGNIGTDSRTSGTRSASTNLGVFTDDGTFSYTGRVRDDDGAYSSTRSGTLRVLNVAPTISNFEVLVPMAFEGQAAYAFLDATDPGEDPLSFYLNGEYIGNDTDTSGTRSISKNLGIFEDSGTFSYTAEVRDDDGGISNTVTRTFNIRNLPPTLLLDSPFPETVNEGDSVLLSLSATDPGKDAIDFLLNGEVIGTDNSTSGTRTFSENLNLFGDDGTFDYRIEARDDDNGYSNTFFRKVTVNNVAPTFDFDIPTINEGESAVALFNATDPGTDAISFFLNDKNIATDSSTSGTRSFTHDLGIFDDDGIFEYTAFALDDDGGKSNIVTKNFEVKNVAPTITNITKDFEIYPEQLFDFAVAATDPGKDKLTYHWDFDGDGSYNDYIRDSGKWSFTDPGDYTVGVKVSDGDGGVTYDSFKVAVKPIKPPYTMRFTDIKGIEGDSDKFQFEFEVANWTGAEVGGVYFALTDSPGGASVQKSPFFNSADINKGTVVDVSKSAIEYKTDTLIPTAELTDIDSGKNVFDGFVMTVDDFDVTEVMSFNWFLLGKDGMPIGTAASGSEYAFGTLDLGRLADGDSEGYFEEMPLSKLSNLFKDGVNKVTDTIADTVTSSKLGTLGSFSSSFTAAPQLSRDFNGTLLSEREPSPPLFAGIVETGLTAAFQNPEDNKFDVPINISLNPEQPESVPEPSSILAMFGLAAASLFGLKRRR